MSNNLYTWLLFGTIYAVDSGYEATVWCDGAWWHCNTLLSRDSTSVKKLCYILYFTVLSKKSFVLFHSWMRLVRSTIIFSTFSVFPLRTLQNITLR